MRTQTTLRILFSLVLSSFAPFVATQAEATTVAVLDDAQLVDFADTIALVSILSMESFWSDDHVILTRVKASVQEVYKGNAAEEIVFYVRGGRVGDVVQSVQGEYRPDVGEMLVVFLENIPRYGNIPMLLGLSQGAFIVEDIPMMRSDQKFPIRVHRSQSIPCRNDSGICKVQTLDDLKSAIDMAKKEK